MLLFRVEMLGKINGENLIVLPLRDNMSPYRLRIGIGI